MGYLDISTNDCSHLINRFLIYIQYNTVQDSRYSRQRLLLYDKKNIALNHDVQMCHQSFHFALWGFRLIFSTNSYFLFAELQNAKCKLQEYKERGRE